MTPLHSDGGAERLIKAALEVLGVAVEKQPNRRGVPDFKLANGTTIEVEATQGGTPNLLLERKQESIEPTFDDATTDISGKLYDFADAPPDWLVMPIRPASFESVTEVYCLPGRELWAKWTAGRLSAQHHHKRYDLLAKADALRELAGAFKLDVDWRAKRFVGDASPLLLTPRWPRPGDHTADWYRREAAGRANRDAVLRGPTTGAASPTDKGAEAPGG